MEPEELARLMSGDTLVWATFITRFGGLILGAVRRVAGTQGDVEDIAQDVFVRLCKDDYRLLRQYDPARASLSTWLTIVSRSVAHDALRRRRMATQSLDDTAESALAVTHVMPEHIKLPEGLLSPRQQLVITMLYDREMDVAEIASALGIDAQTVRSMHHKAMLKLRAHFKDSM